MINMGQIQIPDLQGRHRHHSPGKVEVDHSEKNSVLKICSTCSLVAVDQQGLEVWEGLEDRLVGDLLKHSELISLNFSVFSATFGPGGFRTTRMGGGFPRQQPAPAQADRNQLIALLPILFIFLFPVLSSIVSGLFSTPPIPDPAYSYDKTTQFSSLRYTTPHKVPYHINPTQFSKHPIWESLSPEAQKVPQAGNVGHSPQLKTFEKKIEERFAQAYWDQCQREEQRKRNEISAEQGLFGIGTDWEKVRKIQERKLESCQILIKHGFIEG
jgi:DnaJ family protein B protein 12